MCAVLLGSLDVLETFGGITIFMFEELGLICSVSLLMHSTTYSFLYLSIYFFAYSCIRLLIYLSILGSWAWAQEAAVAADWKQGENGAEPPQPPLLFLSE